MAGTSTRPDAAQVLERLLAEIRAGRLKASPSNIRRLEGAHLALTAVGERRRG